jgi:DNA-binding transcriptional regulator of glucitol operon
VHLAVLVIVLAFLRLGWWQVDRAAAGNLLSYGYAFQWPAFAAFVVWVWVVEMRKARRRAADAGPAQTPQAQAVRSAQPAHPRRRPRNEAAYDDSDDPQLAAYNHYLAWLNAHPHATPADYPGYAGRTSTEESM